MVKLLSFTVLERVSVKKVVEDPSCLAFTSIVTPEEGMAELIVTVNGKVGPGAGGSVVPLAGVVVITREASLLQVSVFFFLQ